MSCIIKLLFLFSAVLLVACGPASESKADLQESQNKALVHRDVEEVWNQGNLDVIDEIFASYFILHDPAVGDVRGPEDYKEQYVTIYRTAFPDIKFTIEDQIIEGDKVVNRWTFTGTHKGELMGILPTGMQVTATGVDIYRIAGGKIVEAWVSGDDLGILQQLGMELKPKEVEK